MRIAQVAPLFQSIPPSLYGGTERGIAYLCDELVRQGHEVTLFASGDSQTAAQLVAACPRALWGDANCHDMQLPHARLMELVFEDVSRFDILHFHCAELHFPFLRRHPWPSVTTPHGPLYAPEYQALFREYADIPLASISNDQRRPIPWANWQGTVYHGLPHDLHTFREKPADYLVFLGRMSPEKRPDLAIEIAQRAEMKLKMAARIFPADRDYFHSTVEPLLQEAADRVEFIGEIGGAAKDQFLGNALALLFPIDWPEPFGLVQIEALACGTPVIAFRKGSVPEVITDGVTGFIVNSVDEAVKAVGRVQELSRATCRATFEQRFTAARMAGEYVELYERLIG
jgi:glycosyltransferase involved in cell wall biosynthesis